MEATNLHQFLVSKPPLLTINPLKFFPISPNQIFFQPIRQRQPPRIKPIQANVTDGAGDSSPPQVSPEITPTEKVEVRFRKRSRRRSKEEGEDGAAIGNGRPKKAAMEIASKQPKKWEDMSMAEKVMELYVGEKGLLFWLNKFAYASIFIMIGAWILFRFVGPSLNLYQLDTQPLSPTSIFKG